MNFSHVITICCGLTVVATGLSACTPTPPPEAILPAPGAMNVLSVTPVEGRDNLIPNGDFAEWYGGLPFPTGFDAPTNRARSRVERDIMYGHLGTAGYTARQTWEGFDFDELPPNRFGVTLDVEPGHEYELTVVASAAGGMSASIDVYVEDGTGAYTLLAGTLIEVRGDEPQEYIGRFYSGGHTSVSLRAQASPLAALPGTVLWSSWGLRSVPEINDVDVGSGKGAWIRNSLDHVQRQFALYGGTTQWSSDLYTLHKNLGRIRREAAEVPGPALLGYDQYIFQEIELDYVKDVADFVHVAGESGPHYQPSFQTLVKLDRLLADRGIELIVVPLPDRVHLYVDKIHKSALTPPPSYLAHTSLLAALLEKGVLAIDVAPLLADRRAQGEDVYWRSDYEVPSTTLAAVADYIAPVIQDVDGVPTGRDGMFEITNKEIPLPQRAVPALPPAQQAIMEKESRTLRMVLDQAGKAFVPAQESAVLVVGSLATLHGESGASLAAQLSHALGFAVSVINRPLEDQEVPHYLLDTAAAELESSRGVVFCFPEYALLRPGW